MHAAKPLPPQLLERYQEWRQGAYAEKRALFKRLADEGQAPSAFVIACCDSRLAVDDLLGQAPGQVFVHRSIANLAPPHGMEMATGTVAAVNYAVEALGVQHLLVLGHSHCGGVAGCIQLCTGEAPELEEPASALGLWLEPLRLGFSRLKDMTDPASMQTPLEKMGVRISLENLMGYPEVAKAVKAKRLTLHGLWMDISEGRLEALDGATGKFKPLAPDA